MEPLPAWYLRRRAHYLPGNEVQLLKGGQELFAALVAVINKARYEVLLTTYIFHHDESARAVAQALLNAAQRGVRVRVVVDGFGSIQSVATLRQWWAQSPVSLVVYRPLDRWWTLLQSEHLRRLHQKVAVVDGEIGFVGGINVIDDCIDLHDGPQSTPRLDYAIQVRGPVVAPKAARVHMARARELLRSMRLAPRPAGSPSLPWPQPTEPSHPGTVEAAFLLRDNLRQRHSVQAALLQACGQARHEIDIACPYFYPGRVLRRALLQAAQRGVRVRLLLQGRPDYRIAALAARVLYRELLGGGVNIFEYQAGALHAKVVRVDERWATVGSSNLDPLSLLVNFEANLAIRDGGFVREVAQTLETAFAQSRAVLEPPVTVGWAGALRRRAVALLARLYLRLAGVPSNY